MSDMASHPIILHADLFAEDERAPQTQFVAERQVAFLEALATSGSVRAAARRARVSHQTCYRARRNSAAFGRAWDAALVVARGAAEAKLADYAMNGVEEEVWYHGDLVGQRRRFSDRLLLAHLGRLDRMRGDARIEALAEDFDGMLTRMRRGEAIEEEGAENAWFAAQAGTSRGRAQPHEARACAGDREGAGSVDPGGQLRSRQARGERGENSSPGPCNTRSMSPGEGGYVEPACDCVGARQGSHGGQRHYRMTARGPEPVCNVAGEGPCCDDPCWPDCRDCPHYPPVSRQIHEMAEARPEEAPALHELGGDPAEVEACQWAAFEAGDEDWWRYGADWVLHRRDARGAWVPGEAEMGQGG
ncbi:hypothetical protein [Qipengyuania sp.]|uniref:hypothetical protein n=1 Tax=Qipengyuania sp. TaxID=2004515 RepID=UPI0035164190